MVGRWLGPWTVQVRVCRGWPAQPALQPGGETGWARWPQGPQLGCLWPPRRVRTGPAPGACPTLPSLPGAASCGALAHLNVSGVLVAGGCAGALAWAVATPMDVIKAAALPADPVRHDVHGLLHW